MFDFDWKIYAALALVFFLMALPVLHRKLYGKVPEMNADDLLQLNQNYQLIDIRPEKAFHESHIENAISMPCTKFENCKQQIFQLVSSNDQTNPVVLVCDTDLISTRMAKKLIDMELENIFILKGGFNFWKRKRLPLYKV